MTDVNYCCICGKKLTEMSLFINVIYGERKYIKGISFQVVNPTQVCSTDCMLQLMSSQMNDVKHWVTDIYPSYKNITKGE